MYLFKNQLNQKLKPVVEKLGICSNKAIVKARILLFTEKALLKLKDSDRSYISRFANELLNINVF